MLLDSSVNWEYKQQIAMCDFGDDELKIKLSESCNYSISCIYYCISVIKEEID